MLVSKLGTPSGLAKWNWRGSEQLVTMNIGILGGTFDPVHLGHLSIAGSAIEQASLEQVLFMNIRLI